jgi:hypothetical protein
MLFHYFGTQRGVDLYNAVEILGKKGKSKERKLNEFER